MDVWNGDGGLLSYLFGFKYAHLCTLIVINGAKIAGAFPERKRTDSGNYDMVSILYSKIRYSNA
jgi:hypothetical protein